MKYAYQIDTKGNVHLTSGENIIFWKEISENEYNIYIDARHNKNQIIYADENGNLQIRDKLTNRIN
jgi:hypothetical protein